MLIEPLVIINGEVILKTCSRCHIRRSISQFYVSKRKDDKRVSIFGKNTSVAACCRQCVSAAQPVSRIANREWRHRNKEKVKGYDRKRKYGLTPAAFALLPDHCQICFTRERLCVDHDHRSGLVRSRLCHKCNVSIAGFQEDPLLLANAIAYLLKYAG